MRQLAPVAALVVLLALPGGVAAGQQEPSTTPESRAEALRAAREAKAAEARPYDRNALERAMNLLESRGFFLLAREGFYPKLGSLTTGSGFAYGVGFRDRDLLRHQGILEVFAAASLRKYWALNLKATHAPIGSRYFAEAELDRREYPSEDFFGVGPDARRRDRTGFMLRRTSAALRAGVRPVPAFRLGGGLEYLAPRSSSGQDDSLPSIQEVFSPDEAPGLGTSVNFTRTSAFAQIDYRYPVNAREGGWYRVDFSRFDDHTSGRYTFNRVAADLRQFIGFLSGRRVIALRGAVSSAVPEEGNVVPFYLMPSLGGNSTLRGFREYRYRGPHAMLLQAEYRWEVWSGLDAALFYDAGKVAMSRKDINFRGLERDYGFGFRFNTDNGVVMRVDAGFGSRDGKQLYVTFGGVF